MSSFLLFSRFLAISSSSLCSRADWCECRGNIGAGGGRVSGWAVSPLVGCGEPGSGVSCCWYLLGCGGPFTVHFFFFSLLSFLLMRGLTWIRFFCFPCLAYSFTFISVFPVVVVKARGQDIFCSLQPRAGGGLGDEGDTGRPEVRRHGGVASLWSFRYCRFSPFSGNVLRQNKVFVWKRFEINFGRIVLNSCCL